MASSSGLAIGLSFLFGFVLIAFVAEIYYLLWWKKKTTQDIENQDSSSSSSSNYTPTYLSCFKNHNSSRTPKTHPQDLQNCVDENQENQEKEEKDLNLKGFGEESLDLELMRLHNLCGPPRFLFTINEETKEDLEVESKKGGSRTMSLSELLCTPETPNGSSSPLKMNSQASKLEGYLNPLYDCCESNDYNKVRSSPPPTFKFLRDAEDKLLKRLMQLEAEKRARLDHHHQMSTTSKVLPLASSPSN
ncbi:hypothetical protein QVD17_34330 [Tagetes erecta]|uniref:Transmembrane protein n=1 Tax=Tagetes erecta TaxID=13708 RepID=A0AAD8K491_TARER|nr:hypothetical protein QVD17_34330 [Tagetes erecta]